MSTCRTFVGFGFGAIQAGLFLYEAHRTGAFSRLVVAEVNVELVAALRASRGYFTLNIAHADRVEHSVVGPIEVYDPGDSADREALINAIAEASELATALPSVSFYADDQPGSVHRLLAQGFSRESRAAVVYTAENHNHAAEALESAVRTVASETALTHRQFLNTVIGKMSGVVQADASKDIVPLLPGHSRAFLVEEFNRILVSRVHVVDAAGTSFQRAISAFAEKDDLLPFEEAKLYGHNAIHAMGGYLARLRGLRTFAELSEHVDILGLLRAAFIEESGAALVRKYADLDPLFTEAGFKAYADDLLTRMVNPHLDDAIERVTRDAPRKLGWDDRLIGSIRLVMSQGIPPTRLALGAAAALRTLYPELEAQPENLESRFRELLPEACSRHADWLPVLALLQDALSELEQVI